MELKEFISETIFQISQGIRESMDKCKELDVIVNPRIVAGSKNDYALPKKEFSDVIRRVEILEMDISVIVATSSEKENGGKIGISTVGINRGSKTVEDASNTSRIKFSIPVCFPVTDIKTENSNF